MTRPDNTPVNSTATGTTYACLLAGGSGTRFWPASTAKVPKQFIPLTGGGPMIRECYERIVPLASPERTVIVTSAATLEQVCALIPEVPRENVLGEPEGRNTAAACALAVNSCAESPSSSFASTAFSFTSRWRTRPASSSREAS